MNMRIACYHARAGFPGRKAERFGQPVKVLVMAKRGTHPRNVLIQFRDGTKIVTSIGCLRWKCDKHGVNSRNVSEAIAV